MTVASGWSISITSIIPDIFIFISNSLENLSTPHTLIYILAMPVNVFLIEWWNVSNMQMHGTCCQQAAGPWRFDRSPGWGEEEAWWQGGTSWQLAAQELCHLTIIKEFEIIFHSLGQNVQFCSFQCKYPGWMPGKCSSLSLHVTAGSGPGLPGPRPRQPGAGIAAVPAARRAYRG